MQPKWEQLEEFVWSTPLHDGWLCQDIRDSERYYESDPQRMWGNPKRGWGYDWTPFEDPPVVETDMLQIVDIADSLTRSAWVN